MAGVAVKDRRMAAGWLKEQTRMLITGCLSPGEELKIQTQTPRLNGSGGQNKALKEAWFALAGPSGSRLEIR